MNSEDCSNGIMIFKTTEHLELKDCVRLELFFVFCYRVSFDMLNKDYLT